jgi:hypothetical protein
MELNMAILYKASDSMIQSTAKLSTSDLEQPATITVLLFKSSEVDIFNEVIIHS